MPPHRGCDVGVAGHAEAAPALLEGPLGGRSPRPVDRQATALVALTDLLDERGVGAGSRWSQTMVPPPVSMWRWSAWSAL